MLKSKGGKNNRVTMTNISSRSGKGWVVQSKNLGNQQDRHFSYGCKGPCKEPSLTICRAVLVMAGTASVVQTRSSSIHASPSQINVPVRLCSNSTKAKDTATPNKPAQLNRITCCQKANGCSCRARQTYAHGTACQQSMLTAFSLPVVHVQDAYMT